MIRKGKWNPSCKNEYPVSTSAGYRSSSIKQEELFNLLDKVDTRCDVVAEGMAAKLLGYSAQEVIDCVLTYTLLKNHRLADCTLNFDEMVNEEGNTFVYLLNTLAEIYTIIANSRKDIDELKKASEIDEGLGGGEERALEKSCLCVLPHILCEHLYELSKKFTNYYLSVYKVGSVAKISTVLLCEATALVMEKCFHLLGLTPDFTNHVYSSLLGLQSSAEQPMDVNAPVVVEAKFILDKELVDRCITPCFASVARDPPRNSRFELFSIRPSITTYSKFEKCNLFGLISVSDQYGVFSDGGPQLLEPDFANVSLFNHDWCNPINMRNEGVVYLGNPSSCHSVPFSSSIEIRMELYVTTEKKDGCFQLYNREFKLDLSTFWEEKSGSKCSCLDVNGEDGITQMRCILLKDAVDTFLEVRFKTKTSGRKVRGNVFAYYGSNFLYECHPSVEACDMALLFQSDIPSVLEDDKIPLKKSILAVPKNGSLIIKACFEDVESGEVILEGSYEFSSQIQGSSIGDINGREGIDCSLDMKINWKYGAQYL
ncbi:arginine--tRNA ligase, chloroplastic/mitochondrial [Tanacetum coccineum]